MSIHTVLYRVRYLPATGTKGSRFAVTYMPTGRRRVVDFDYSANYPREAAVKAAFPDAVPEALQWAGETRTDSFYVEAFEDEA